MNSFREQTRTDTKENCEYCNGVWVSSHTSNGKHIKGYCRSKPNHPNPFIVGHSARKKAKYESLLQSYVKSAKKINR